MPPTISPSQLELFGCKFAWYLGIKLGYSLIQPPVNYHLDLGSGVHYALERYYGANKSPVKAFQRWVDKRMTKVKGDDWSEQTKVLMEVRTMGTAMLEGYIKRYKGKEKFEVISTEEEMVREIITDSKPSGCKVLTRVDAIVKDIKLGEYFVMEHKTFTKFEQGQLARDHQFVAEAWVASGNCKYPISGVIYNGLRKQIPSSRVKLDLFERHYIYINPHQMKVFKRRAFYTWQEMRSPNFKPYPEPNNIRCNMCEFKEVCTAYGRGDDFQFLLNTLYQRKQR